MSMDRLTKTVSDQRLARSSTRLTHADKVSFAFAAAREYLPYLSSLTLTVRYRRSPFSTGGLPLVRLDCSMIGLCTNK